MCWRPSRPPPDEERLRQRRSDVLDDLGRYQDSERDARTALGLARRRDPGSTAEAAALHRLGQALARQGKYAEALEYYRRARAIKEKTLGKEHPETASTLHSMGQALASQGKYAEALEYYGRARAIKKKTLGKEYPSLLPSRANLGDLLARMGRVQEARQEMETALVLARKLDLPFDLGNVLFKLAQVLRSQGDARAEDNAAEALALLEPLLGGEHPLVGQVRGFLLQRTAGVDALLRDTLGLLAGLGAVTRSTVLRLGQRVLLRQQLGDWPTQLALAMGRPGLELDDATALEIPAHIDDATAAKMRESLPTIREAMARAKAALELLLPEPRVDTPPRGTEYGGPADGPAALVDEAAALVMGQEQERLRADLGVVLRGLALLVEQSDEPGALGLVFNLLERLPEQAGQVAQALRPACSPRQWEALRPRLTPTAG